jgi:hypothetical protein
MYILLQTSSREVNLYNHVQTDKRNSLSKLTAEEKVLRDYTRREDGRQAKPRAWCHSGGSVPAGDGSHSTDQPKGTDVGHTKLSVGFSKVIPEKTLARLSILILSKAYPGLGILSP